MSYLYLNQAFNIFAGDAGPDNDKSKIIGDLQFPDLEEMTAEHHPGGARVGMEIGGMGVKPLVVKYGSNGWDPHAMGLIGVYNAPNVMWTLRASVRNKNGDVNTSAKCVVRGRLTKHSPSQMKRGDMYKFDHEIKEIDYYLLEFDGKPKYEFSYWSNVFKIDGTSQNVDELAALGLSDG